MSLRMFALLCLVAFSAAHAADIVAWKTPLESLTPEGKDTPGITRCDAPEDSPFFSPGDELWDVKAAIPAQVDWLVWNATTGRIVAKANAANLWQIHHRIGCDTPPLQCRLRFRLLAAPADGSEPSAEAEALAELSLVTRSNKEFSGTHESGGNSISASGTANWSLEDRRPDLTLNLTGRGGGQPPLEIKTHVLLQPETTLWLARDFDGTRGLDLTASATLELPDGSPARTAVMRVEHGKAVPVVPAEVRRQHHKLAGGGVLVIAPFGLGSLQNHMAPEVDPTIDPFVPKELDARAILADLEPVAPPAEIREWIDHQLLDVSELPGDLGAPADFAGFAPLSGTLVLRAPDAETANRLLVTTGPSIPSLVVIDFTGGTGSHSRLVTRTAMRARLSSGAEDPGKRHRTFAIEPVLGVPNSLVDLRLDYHENSGSGAAASFQGSVALAVDTPLEVIAPAPTGFAGLKVKASRLLLHKR